MTASNDFDRRLTEWFADAPPRAPERAIADALEHAAAHPRRRDVFAPLRRDAMRSPVLGGSMRILPLVAALGLLILAVLAVGTAGGWFDRTPVVVPPAVPSPSTSPTAEPTEPVGPSPQATSPALPSATPAVIHVDLIESVGADASVDITDRSGRLVRALSGVPADGGSVEEGTIQIDADVADPMVVILTWTGSPCDTTHTLDIAPDLTLSMTRPACGGDAVPADHKLQLVFDSPVDPATMSGTVVTIGAPSGG